MVRDFLLHGSNTALIAAAIIIGAVAATDTVTLFPLWIVAGVALFYLSEYGWHRFVFHAPPSNVGWLRLLQHRLHYDHHVDPARLDLLFLPIVRTALVRAWHRVAAPVADRRRNRANLAPAIAAHAARQRIVEESVAHGARWRQQRGHQGVGARIRDVRHVTSNEIVSNGNSTRLRCVVRFSPCDPS
jgi:hypothetical protein